MDLMVFNEPMEPIIEETNTSINDSFEDCLTNSMMKEELTSIRSSLPSNMVHQPVKRKLGHLTPMTFVKMLLRLNPKSM